MNKVLAYARGINREFSLLLAASMLLSIGSKLYELLLPLIMYDLSGGSTVVMASMKTAELLPNMFFGIIVGVIVDRVNKKKWAIWMILLQAVILLGVFFLFGAGVYQPMLYYALGFMLMTLNYGYFNTQVSLIKISVPSEHLTSANAKFSFVDTFVGIMGPVFLGIVLLFSTKQMGLLIPVLLYMLAYLLVLQLRIEEKNEQPEKTSFWSELKEGLHAFKQNRALMLMCFFIFFLNSSMAVVSTAILVYGTKDLQLSNAVLSMVLATAGVGGLTASLSMNYLRKRFQLGVMFGVAIIASVVSYFGFYFSTNLVMFIPFLFLHGFGASVYVICIYTFRHEQTPAQYMGRIGGITATLFRLGMPVAMLSSGYMMAWWGTSSVFICAAVINSLVFVFYKKSMLWQLP